MVHLIDVGYFECVNDFQNNGRTLNEDTLGYKILFDGLGKSYISKTMMNYVI